MITTLFPSPVAQEPDLFEIRLVDFVLISLLALTGLAALAGAALLLPFAMLAALEGALGAVLLFLLLISGSYAAAACHSAYRLCANPTELPRFVVVCSLTCIGFGYLLWPPAAIPGTVMFLAAILLSLRGNQN